MGPFNPSDLGVVGGVLVFMAIGFGFGFILESAGFGNSKKLAGQFYFTDSAVVKVMFTSVIVAAALMAWATALGLVNYDRIFVNPTVYGPGMLGGLLMGFGFILGGYCPGTSLTAVATLKKDGIMFVAGALIGVFAFGESVGTFNDWWQETGLEGRLTVSDVTGLDVGVIVFILALVGIVAFWGLTQVRIKLYGAQEGDTGLTPNKTHAIAAAALVVVTLPLLVFHQPTLEQKWENLPAKQAALDNREVQIDPGELFATMQDDTLNLILFDLQSESDWNKFHLMDAKHTTTKELVAQAAALKTVPSNSIIVLMAKDETAPTEAWKLLTAAGVLNLYILDHGLDKWLAVYGAAGHHEGSEEHHGDEPKVDLTAALGTRNPASRPNPHHAPDRKFTKKIKLKKKVKLSGGCG